MDVICGNGKVIGVDHLDFRAPAPIGTAIRVGIIAQYREALVFGVACAKHDSRIVVEAVHPTGFVAVERCVVTKGEQAVLWFVVHGSLIEIQREASIQYQLDTALRLGFDRNALWLEPCARLACPAADEFRRGVGEGWRMIFQKPWLISLE